MTLTVGSASTFSVQSSRLLTADGNEVTGFTLLPGRQLDAGEWCFMAQEPLRPGAAYTAEVTGTLDGQPFTQHWSFTVTGPQ